MARGLVPSQGQQIALLQGLAKALPEGVRDLEVAICDFKMGLLNSKLSAL